MDQGLNIQQYVREFIGRMRDLLMMKLGLEDKVLGSAEDKKALASDSEQFSEQELIRNFDMLLRLENELNWTSQPRFHLEVGLVKLAKSDMSATSKKSFGISGKAAPYQSPAPLSVSARRTPQPSPAPARTSFTCSQLRHLSHLRAGSTLQRVLRLQKNRRTANPVPTHSDPASRIMDAAKDEPLVKRFLEVFRGDVAQVKPSKGESTMNMQQMMKQAQKMQEQLQKQMEARSWKPPPAAAWSR